MRKDVSKNKAKALLIGGCAAAIAVGGTLAYLTASSSASNEFQVAPELDGKIKVVEENWDTEAAKNILPSQTVAKDPKLKNESPVDVYAIMQVSVPYKEIVTADSEGNVQNSATMELFTYQVKSKWTELGEAQLSDDGTARIHTYLYAEPLKADTETDTVFDEVTLANAIDGQIDGSSLTIDVDGFAIQTEGFASGEEAWKAYQNQNQIQEQN